MVQIGLNMGPCHACILGWAKSFTQTLSSDEEMIQQDTDLQGGMSLLWALTGHTGTSCPFPQAGLKTFFVFDMSGPHSITIDYCNCGDKPLKIEHSYYVKKGF